MKMSPRKQTKGRTKVLSAFPVPTLIFITPPKHPLVYPIFQVWKRGALGYVTSFRGNKPEQCFNFCFPASRISKVIIMGYG